MVSEELVEVVPDVGALYGQWELKQASFEDCLYVYLNSI